MKVLVLIILNLIIFPSFAQVEGKIINGENKSILSAYNSSKDTIVFALRGIGPCNYSFNSLMGEGLFNKSELVFINPNDSVEIELIDRCDSLFLECSYTKGIYFHDFNKMYSIRGDLFWIYFHQEGSMIIKENEGE